MRLVAIMMWALSIAPSAVAMLTDSADDLKSKAGVADTDTKRNEPEWGSASEGFRLSLRGSAKSVAVGEPVELQIVLQNVDTKDRKVVNAIPVYIYQFAVQKGDGKAAPKTERGKELIDGIQDGSRAVDTVKPKEEISSKIRISELFDLTQPGEYKITVSRQIWGRDDKTVASVISNSLVVKITGPSDKKDK